MNTRHCTICGMESDTGEFVWVDTKSRVKKFVCPSCDKTICAEKEKERILSGAMFIIMIFIFFIFIAI